MAKNFLSAVMLGLSMGGLAFAQTYHPISDVTATTAERDGDLWPVSNLIQGPGVGFEEAEPQNAVGGGSGNLDYYRKICCNKTMAKATMPV